MPLPDINRIILRAGEVFIRRYRNALVGNGVVERRAGGHKAALTENRIFDNRALFHSYAAEKYAVSTSPSIMQPFATSEFLTLEPRP